MNSFQFEQDNMEYMPAVNIIDMMRQNPHQQAEVIRFKDINVIFSLTIFMINYIV